MTHAYHKPLSYATHHLSPVLLWRRFLLLVALGQRFLWVLASVTRSCCPLYSHGVVYPGYFLPCRCLLCFLTTCQGECNDCTQYKQDCYNPYAYVDLRRWLGQVTEEVTHSINTGRTCRCASYSSNRIGSATVTRWSHHLYGCR